MGNKQTAIEWLVDKLMKAEFINNPNELIEQAKAMEKEQSLEFFTAGQDSMEEGGKSFDQYYNETYD